MYTLGINAAFHDSAAGLIKDGVLIAAAEDERFTHIKHGKRPIPFTAYELPFHAIDYCLQEAGICLNEVDHIAYSFNPAAARNEGWRKAKGELIVFTDDDCMPQPECLAQYWQAYIPYSNTAIAFSGCIQVPLAGQPTYYERTSRSWNWHGL